MQNALRKPDKGAKLHHETEKERLMTNYERDFKD